MDRRDFINTCSLTCLSIIGVQGLLSSCSGTKHIQVVENAGSIAIQKTQFLNKEKYYRQLIVRTAGLNFPIVVYRISATEYRAFLLECPHQGAELTVSGDIISCSAHGSEFSNMGQVIQGPAATRLKTFKVDQTIADLIITLK